MNNIKKFSIILLNFLSVITFGQNSSSEWIKSSPFCIGSKYGTTEIWGRPKSIEARHFNEMLPAFFSRRLNFGASDLQNDKLQWVFTGEQGGITIELSKDSLSILQRYYDSFGYTPFTGTEWTVTRANPYPVKQVFQQKIALKEKTKTISVKTTHDFKLQVFVNDLLAIEQLSQIDLSQHQLKMLGFNGQICGELEVPTHRMAKVVVNSKMKYQEIIGFGGTTSPVSYHLLSPEGKEKWWKYIHDYNFLIQREYPNGKKLKPDYSNWDNLEDASVHYYGDNFPNGEISDFGYNKIIQDKGGIVIFEFWQLPDFVTDKSIPVTGEGLFIKVVPIIEKYCEAMVNYCKTAQLKTGKAPAIVGIQNELSQSKDIWWKMTTELRKALDKNGFTKTKIHTHNSPFFKDGIEALKAFTENPEIWEKIDFSSSNLYDYQANFTDPDKFDEKIQSWNKVLQDKKLKPFLAIEMCVNDPKYQSGSYKVAFIMGELYHKDLTMMNAAALGYCWNLVHTTQPSFEASRSLFAIDKKYGNIPVPSSYQLRIMGSYSRHLPKGIQRIEAATDQKDLLISAFENKNNKTLILANRSNKPMSVAIDWKNTHFRKMELTDPYNQNTVKPFNGNPSVFVEAGSVVTLFL
jgi:hypothetical protein